MQKKEQALNAEIITFEKEKRIFDFLLVTIVKTNANCKKKKKWRSIAYAAKYESRDNLNFLQAASVLSHKSPESFIEMQWTNTCIDWLEHMSPHIAIRNDCCLAVCGLWNKCSQSVTGCCHRLWSVDRNSLVIDYVVDCTLWFFLHISSNNEAHYWFSERHY